MDNNLLLRSTPCDRLGPHPPEHVAAAVDALLAEANAALEQR